MEHKNRITDNRKAQRRVRYQDVAQIQKIPRHMKGLEEDRRRQEKRGNTTRNKRGDRKPSFCHFRTSFLFCPPPFSFRNVPERLQETIVSPSWDIPALRAPGGSYYPGTHVCGGGGVQ